MSRLRNALRAAGAVAGGALAVASGAGVLMAAACALGGAGVPDTVITLTKGVVRGLAKATGQTVGPEYNFDKNDAATVVALGAALGALHTAAPTDVQRDPSTHLLVGFGAVGLTNAVATIVSAPEAVANAVENTRRRIR